MLFESLPGALQVFLEGLFRSTWSLLGASWSQLGASWAPLGANLEPLGGLLEPTWSQLGASWVQLGASWEQLGTSWGPLEHNLALWGASWVQFGASWMPFGRLLGSTSSSWTPLGSSQRHLNSTCFPSGVQVQLGLHLGFQLNSKRQLELHFGQQSSFRISFVIPEGLPSPTILQLYSPRAVKCNSKALPTKLHVAGWRHMQH